MADDLLVALQVTRQCGKKYGGDVVMALGDVCVPRVKQWRL